MLNFFSFIFSLNIFKNNFEIQIDELKTIIETKKNDERKRLVNFISSELHDNISQLVSLALMNTNAVQETQENKKHKKNIHDLLSKSLKDLKFIINTIQLSETIEIDLEYHLEQIINNLNRSTNIVFKRIGQAPALNNDKNYILLRILQELLTNILKHSEATCVNITFHNYFNKSNVHVTHDGIKFKPIKKDFNKGNGLKNIHDNINLLNGNIYYEFENCNTIIKLPLTRVWRNGGLSAKFNGSNSITA